MIALLLTVGAVAWLALLLAAPVMPDGVAALLDAAGSILCHQIPDRSFVLAEHRLPVCGRCLGLYAGAAAGAVLEVSRGVGAAAREALPRRAVRWLLGLGAVPTVLSLVLEWTGAWSGSNAWRCAAGVLLGGAAAVVAVRAVAASGAAHGRLLD